MVPVLLISCDVNNSFEDTVAKPMFQGQELILFKWCDETRLHYIFYLVETMEVISFLPLLPVTARVFDLIQGVICDTPK